MPRSRPLRRSSCGYMRVGIDAGSFFSHYQLASHTNTERFVLLAFTTMLFSIALLGLLEGASALVPRVPAAEKPAVCKNGLYGKLAPLAYYPPAQDFCKKKYPNTVTVTSGKVKRQLSTTPAAPSTTTRAGLSTTPATTTRSATTLASTTKAAATTAKCTKDALACLFSSVVGEGAKTVSSPIVFHYSLLQVLAICSTVFSVPGIPPKFLATNHVFGLSLSSRCCITDADRSSSSALAMGLQKL